MIKHDTRNIQTSEEQDHITTNFLENTLKEVYSHVDNGTIESIPHVELKVGNNVLIVDMNADIHECLESFVNEIRRTLAE